VREVDASSQATATLGVDEDAARDDVCRVVTTRRDELAAQRRQFGVGAGIE
jgi:hypothetical protein